MTHSRPPRPALALLFLAPLLGELVSGHLSPAEFFNPIGFIVLALPYGFGALVCRELTVRWRKGWPTLLLLALAYGMYEEGLVARSIWDPNWAELGAIGNYSFRAGVSWTYAAMLLHFHVVVSVGTSVLVAHLLYPERRSERWLSTGSLIACGIGLAAWSPALLLLHPFTPSPWHVGTAVAFIALAATAARIAPRHLTVGGRHKARLPIAAFLVAAMNTTAVFVTIFALPEWAPSWLPPWPVSLAVFVCIDALAALLIVRWSCGGQCWDDRHRFALLAGVLAFFIVFNLFSDLADDFRGRSIVALATMWWLWWLWSRRISMRRA